MRQKLLTTALIAVAAIGALGLLIWAASQGFLGANGPAKRLLNQSRKAVEAGNLESAQAKLEELVGKYPESPIIPEALLELGGVYATKQQPTEARATYRLLIERFPDSTLLPDAQAKLGDINVALLFSSSDSDLKTSYEVKAGDSLGKIAKANATTVELIKKSNNLSGDVIRPGQKLRVPKIKFNIVVDKSQNQLLLTADNEFFKIYPVATGKDGSTPVGAFKIINKIANPVWYKQGAVVPPDSPENILGTRWMGIDKEGYGIHGSVDPSGIGKQVTAGCVRMHNPDVDELFAIVPVGTQVTIVD
jgi:lipoprotein-anchoring transpeptidase ErfK/SrfK